MRSAEDMLFQRFGRSFVKGTVLFRQKATRVTRLAVIEGRRVPVAKEGSRRRKVLSMLQPGEFFGEMAILNSKARRATAVVSEDAKLLVIDVKTFEAMVRGNSEIALRMIKKLSARLQEADDQIENLLLKDHNRKIVHALVRLAGNRRTRRRARTSSSEFSRGARVESRTARRQGERSRREADEGEDHERHEGRTLVMLAIRRSLEVFGVPGDERAVRRHRRRWPGLQTSKSNVEEGRPIRRRQGARGAFGRGSASRVARSSISRRSSGT